ncbi:hypothetical protein MOC55_13395 [Bacillus spizizenii]|uniref:hypothetical protein n=1 Tax=Bacillus TaxID=1386 RepID=UPI0005F058CE|nr:MULTISPECIES: hypothetical protein [Bacillus subtilis group]MCY8155459.1 hypothetical protein [Bacillus spizizenii]MCB7162991.1 hypothetical protein [Bacillus subtilis]MCB7461481.1 hypothetical protein [Bacillus subtilis]MCY8700510.1 hypothetical protein [Bacillus spizizenii]MCY8864658.1 hypothetical protein [Bacillus spizizenii]
MKFKLTLCAVIALIGVSFISSSLGNEVNVASRNMTSKAANDSTNSLVDKAIFDKEITIAENGTLG